MSTIEELAHQIIEQQMGEIAHTQGSVTQTLMDGPAQRIQIVPADTGLTMPQRIQIVTDQQTGQKIQIVTALDQTATGKQFILTNHDGSAPSRVILARQDATPRKVFLATPDPAGVNQLFLTSPDVSAQHIQILTDNSSTEQSLNKVIDLCVVCGDKASALSAVSLADGARGRRRGHSRQRSAAGLRLPGTLLEIVQVSQLLP
uniref:Uncharacterized protein n=1 Tax=Sphaerodactylus townsendi TaxID=933632 RepID=A0ACB8FP81_9SAUR